MVDHSRLVSVIIPAYNVEAYLARTLDSVSRQTYRNIEIIVLDDGSTDGTAAIAAEAARLDDRIRFVSGPNHGKAAARNAAAALARGEALAPCDADDLWHPNKLERQVDALFGAPSGTGVVYCWSRGIDEHDAVVLPLWKREEAEGDVLEAMIIDSLAGCGSVPLIRREFFDSAGGYPTDCGTDDWRFYIALAATCEWVVVPEYLVGYRLRPGSVSGDYRLMQEELAADTRWIGERWPDLEPDVLRRRSHVVNRYLSFLAARRGHLLRAFRYRSAAERAWPSKRLTLSWLTLSYVSLTQFFGFQRYYPRFWRRPEPWREAG